MVFKPFPASARGLLYPKKHNDASRFRRFGLGWRRTNSVGFHHKSRTASLKRLNEYLKAPRTSWVRGMNSGQAPRATTRPPLDPYLLPLHGWWNTV